MVSVPKAPPPSSLSARAVMRGNRARDTSPELGLRRELHRRGLRYRVHARPLTSAPVRADIVFARARLAVFVDGCFWHRCPDHGTSPRVNSAYWRAKLDRNVERDRESDRLLAEAGWTALRVWEHEQVEEAADRVVAALTALGAGVESQMTESEGGANGSHHELH